MNRPVPRASKVTTPDPVPEDSRVVVLACEFSRRICLALTPDELLELRIRNDEETDPDACASFLLCDPESIMDDASRSIGLELPAYRFGKAERIDERNESIHRIREAAWKLAKQRRFVEGLIS